MKCHFPFEQYFISGLSGLGGFIHWLIQRDFMPWAENTTTKSTSMYLISPDHDA